MNRSIAIGSNDRLAMMMSSVLPPHVDLPCSNNSSSSSSSVVSLVLLSMLVRIGMSILAIAAAAVAAWWARWQAWPVVKGVRAAAAKAASGSGGALGGDGAAAVVDNYIRLPPGSMGLPFWGESLSFLRSWTRDPLNPDVWYDDRLRRFGPVFRTYLFGEPTVVLLGADANKLVLCNEDRLFHNSWPASLRELEGDNAVSMVNGPAHARLRRALAVFLGSAPLRDFLPSMDTAIRSCLADDWNIHHRHFHFHNNNKHEEVLAYPLLQKLTFQLNARLFMGLLPGPRLDAFHSHYHHFTAGLESFPLNLPWTLFGRAKRARNLLLHHIYSFIRTRRQQLEEAAPKPASAADDDGVHDMYKQPEHLLDLLLMSRDEESGEPYSIEEIGDNMLLLVHAGQDTTACALAVILMNLAASPDILAKLKAECRALESSLQKSGRRPQEVRREELKEQLEGVRCAIREGLRLCPPVSGFFKRAKCDVVFQGSLIPKGWKVHIVPRHTHLNPAYFPDPLAFDPSRFHLRRGGFAYIPFGQGARICPGMELAMITMELFLFHLLCSVDDIRLVHPHERMIIRTFSPYPQHGLPLRLFPRIT